MGDSITLQTKPLNIVEPTLDYLDVAFSKQWNTIVLAMEFFEDFTNSRMQKCTDSHKIGTAVSELLENAVKYAKKEGIRILLNKKKKENTIKLKVINYSERKHAKRLLNRVKDLNASDSLSFYLERMRESIKNKDESAGLGLARVYHETGAKISARYSCIKKLVEVTAIITLQNEED